MRNATLNRPTARNGASALVLALSLSACMVGSDYRRAEIDVRAAWRLGGTEASEISNIAWWDQFQDPVLPSLVRTGLANNDDRETATRSADQALAQYGILSAA